MLTRFIKWLVSLFVHEAAEQIKEEISKPSTITDEKVDTKLADALNADVADKLRTGNSGNPADWTGKTR